MSTETKTGHTPGPWHSHDDGPERSYYVCDYPQDSPSYGGNTVARVHPVSSENHHEANARLIAASPDLLAACKALLGFQCLRDYEDTPVIQEARAAIAKAEA